MKFKVVLFNNVRTRAFFDSCCNITKFQPHDIQVIVYENYQCEVKVFNPVTQKYTIQHRLPVTTKAKLAATARNNFCNHFNDKTKKWNFSVSKQKVVNNKPVNGFDFATNQYI